MYQAAMNNLKENCNLASGSPSHAMDVIQTQSDDSKTPEVKTTEVHSCVEKHVNNTTNEPSQADAEHNNRQDVHVDLPSCTTFLTKDEVEKLTVEKVSIESLSESGCELHVEDNEHLELDSSVTGDRNLEQFSEVLLDSDSDDEVIAHETNKKESKRVRFADEIVTTEDNEGKVTTISKGKKTKAASNGVNDRPYKKAGVAIPNSTRTWVRNYC